MVFRSYLFILIMLLASGCNLTSLYTKKVEKSYNRMGMKEWNIELDSSVIHWRRVGRGQKSIVLIHGYGILPQVQWEELAKELYEEYTLYIPDLIYFGESKSIYGQYSPQFQSRQIARSMEQLPVSHPYIAGLSYGGLIAAMVAHENPTGTRGLILIDALSKFTDPDHIQQLADSLEMGNAKGLLLPDNGREMKKLFEVSFHKPPNYSKLFLNSAAKRYYADSEGDKAALLDYLYAHESELREANLQYQGPVLIIWGEKDRLIPFDNAGRLQEYYENAQLAVLPNAGHVVIREKPEEVSEIIKLFAE